MTTSPIGVGKTREDDSLEEGPRDGLTAAKDKAEATAVAGIVSGGFRGGGGGERRGVSGGDRRHHQYCHTRPLRLRCGAPGVDLKLFSVERSCCCYRFGGGSANSATMTSNEDNDGKDDNEKKQ